MHFLTRPVRQEEFSSQKQRFSHIVSVSTCAWRSPSARKLSLHPSKCIANKKRRLTKVLCFLCYKSVKAGKTNQRMQLHHQRKVRTPENIGLFIFPPTKQKCYILQSLPVINKSCCTATQTSQKQLVYPLPPWLTSATFKQKKTCG